MARWRTRCTSECDSAEHGSAMTGIERAHAMRSVNLYVIARNHRVEEALAAASDEGNLAPFERLLDALRQPYDETPELARYAEPAPAAVTACYRTFCGT
jgi:serine/tyrosine/threonine adenylyltransferase